MNREKVLVIDVRLSKGLIMALVGILTIVGQFAYLLQTDKPVAASELEDSQITSSIGMREFYLSKGGSSGSQALTGCASGYHFASLWEIADPTNLKYNTTLGYTEPDSGGGPPTYGTKGWVRTGYISNSSTTPGRANCTAWTNANSGYYGTSAKLVDNWTGGSEDINAWEVGVDTCNNNFRIWCVED